MRAKKKVSSKAGGKAKKGRLQVIKLLTIVLLVTALIFIYLSATKHFVISEQVAKVQIETKAESHSVDSVTKEKSLALPVSSVQEKKVTRSQRRSSASLELPYYSDSTFLVKNRDARYTLMYSPRHKQAEWVAYILTKDEVLRKVAKRKNNFYPDPLVELNGWPSADDDDYRKSGYDRGHMLPSADRDDSDRENRATFCYSNISPQRPGLNRGTWNQLESRVRDWAQRYDTLYVVVGGLIDDDPRRVIGRAMVSVPEYFYKAVLAKSDEGYSAIGFIMPNRDDVSRDPFDYMVSVDSVERRTALDLFSPLPDIEEDRIEQRVDIQFWK